MDNLIKVEINGKIHRLSPRAVELLKIRHNEIVRKEKPIELLRPPKFDLIKIDIKKAEPVKEAAKENIQLIESIEHIEHIEHIEIPVKKTRKRNVRSKE